RLVLADVPLQAGRAEHRAGHTQIEHVSHGNVAYAFGAPDPDRIVGQQLLIFIDAAGEHVDKLFNSLVPAARMIERQAADTDVARHHALAGEHLENAQDVFPLAEAVEEDAHGADID